MANHLWLLPWLALIGGAAALMLGSRAAPAPPGLSSPPLPRSFYAIWLAVTLLLGLAALRLGLAGADFVTARGLALGALGGWALAEICRRRTGPASASLLFGLGTMLVAAGRLWLTHGEVSGLTALAVGAGLAVLCLSLAPALFTPGEPSAGRGTTVGLLYLVCLAAAVQIGFGRAAVRQQAFWADIPLLLGAALALASVRGSQRRLPSALMPLSAAFLLVLLPLARTAPSWRPSELVLLGAVVFGLTARRGRGSGDGQAAAGLVLLAAGSALAFALWSGYGLALLVLGGWLAAGGALLSEEDGHSGRVGMAFASVLLVYRLATLQNSPAVHASGPGDIWDLFAVSLGALLPLVAAEWAVADGTGGRLARGTALVQWIVALIAPALLLDYIWQPRSVAGILLGAAVGMLLTGAAGLARRQEAVLASGVLLSLILFQFLPLTQHVSEPTRAIRVGMVLLGAGGLILRLLLPGGEARKEEGDGLVSPPPA